MQTTNISTSVLKVHPRNTEFFDDISGEEYDRFKQSIQDDGLLSPLVVSPDMTVISGHQRLKACKALGIDTVPVIIREDLKDENEKLKVLLAANFGRSKNDEAKQRRILDEYVKLCGFSRGGDRKSNCQSDSLKLKELAEQNNMSERTLHRLLEIERKLTPELKEILDDGGITKTTASKILVKLSQEDQQALLADLGKDQLAAMTQTQVQEHINKIKELENVVNGYKLKLENRQTETIKVEVEPEDYQEVKQKAIKAREYEQNYKKLEGEYYKKVDEVTEKERQIKAMIELKPEEDFSEKLIKEAYLFNAKVEHFISQIGGLAYLNDSIKELPPKEKQMYIKAINLVESWVYKVKSNMQQYLEN